MMTCTLFCLRVEHAQSALEGAGCVNGERFSRRELTSHLSSISGHMPALCGSGPTSTERQNISTGCPNLPSGRFGDAISSVIDKYQKAKHQSAAFKEIISQCIQNVEASTSCHRPQTSSHRAGKHCCWCQPVHTVAATHGGGAVIFSGQLK